MNAAVSAGGPSTALPLCVDCDGTLCRTDLLMEGVVRLLKRNPFLLFHVVLWAFRGPAALKTEVARRVELDPATIPWHEDLVAFLRAERSTGRRLILVTGAPAPYAEVVGRHLGLFDEIVATTPDRNLVGARKAEYLVDRFGDGNFDYAANELTDVRIWRHAQAAIVVNAPPSVRKAAARLVRVEREFPRERSKLSQVPRALRVHQWLKNLLIFAPLALSHRLLDAALLTDAVLAFACFSLTASAVYIINDLMDLDSDRQHPRKRRRPFAAGTLSVLDGVVIAFGCIAVALALLFVLPVLFGLCLAGYFAATTAYSFWLKNRAIVDVLLLAALYTVRIIAGAAAVAVMPSFWLLALSMFLFLSLAVVKRYAELRTMQREGRTRMHGRGYQGEDLPLLGYLGASAGVCAVLVAALYVNSPDVHLLYPRPMLLWLVPPLLLYWVCRVWLKTHRGEMHDDPIVFAARDRPSLVVGLITAVCVLAASVGA